MNEATKYVPAVEDSDAMTEIHARMHALISRAIPMNFRDEESLNDLLIPGQDGAYECGRRRGTLECNAKLLKALVDLRQQVNDFCVQYGEADFYTGDATAAIAFATEPR